MVEHTKYQHLQDIIRRHKEVAIAYSGGVDSTFLLAAAAETIPGRVTAITVKTDYIPQWEVEEAKSLARDLLVRHLMINLSVPDSIKGNPVERCYLCKKKVFGEILKIAAVNGISVLYDGTNADDTGDFRPGMKALAELNVSSPLLEAGITKAEVRDFSRQMKLPTHDKPAYACLLTRIPYNTEFSTDDLSRIEQSEEFLIRHGVRAVRVRHHGNLARIETDEAGLRLLMQEPFRQQIVAQLKEFGYSHITVDLEGYRMGSFNKQINQNPHYE